MKQIELQELVGGAIQEQFAKAFEKVIENLQNPNTPYRAKRSITIKLTFDQNEQRDDVKVGILVAEKLAPQSPIETAFAIGKDLRTGELYANEYGKQVRGQLHMEDVQPPVNLAPGEKLDAETGEIIGESKSNVIDLRKAVSK